jgi:Uri superfamily endonuclease
MNQEGAYILYLDLPQSLTLDVGVFKNAFFPAGRYAYVGSAARGIKQRIARHRRLSSQKMGRLHWHIDYLLVHPDVRLFREQALAGSNECRVSHQIALKKGITVPVPGFGSSDCRAGCKAHLYRVHKKTGSRAVPI